MNEQRGFIDFTPLIYMGIVLGVVIGGLLFVVLPWLWRVIKPALVALFA